MRGETGNDASTIEEQPGQEKGPEKRFSVSKVVFLTNGLFGFWCSGVKQTFSIYRHWRPELQEYSPEDFSHQFHGEVITHSWMDYEQFWSYHDGEDNESSHSSESSSGDLVVKEEFVLPCNHLGSKECFWNYVTSRLRKYQRGKYFGKYERGVCTSPGKYWLKTNNILFHNHPCRWRWVWMYNSAPYRKEH